MRRRTPEDLDEIDLWLREHPLITDCMSLLIAILFMTALFIFSGWQW